MLSVSLFSFMCQLGMDGDGHDPIIASSWEGDTRLIQCNSTLQKIPNPPWSHCQGDEINTTHQHHHRPNPSPLLPRFVRAAATSRRRRRSPPPPRRRRPLPPPPHRPAAARVPAAGAAARHHQSRRCRGSRHHRLGFLGKTYFFKTLDLVFFK